MHLDCHLNLPKWIHLAGMAMSIRRAVLLFILMAGALMSCRCQETLDPHHASGPCHSLPNIADDSFVKRVQYFLYRRVSLNNLFQLNTYNREIINALIIK